MTSITQTLLLTACCTLWLTACRQSEYLSLTPTLATSAVANVADADVTTHVQSALNNQPSLSGLDIAVVTTKGDVRLTGVVSSQAQIDTAISAAQAAEGAHTVHNKLALKP